jgi:hypothetical protein
MSYQYQIQLQSEGPMDLLLDLIHAGNKLTFTTFPLPDYRPYLQALRLERTGH